MTEFSATPPEAAPMSWVETLVGILLHPRETMRELAVANEGHMTGFGGAAMAVVIPSALDGFRMAPPQNLALASLTIPGSIIMGISLWVTMAGLLSLLAWIFGDPATQGSRQRKTFVLLGWSFAPWFFMAPIYCYRDALGLWFAPLAVVPFAWSFILQILAVKTAFDLKSPQTLLLFFGVPALYFAVQVLQAMQGFYVSFASVL